MVNYFEPVLSEEQMAAYLDGMLSTEQNKMVEEMVCEHPELTEIQDAIDSIDATYIYEDDNEIPIECLSDDFFLQTIDSGVNQIEDKSATDDYTLSDGDGDENGNDEDGFVDKEQESEFDEYSSGSDDDDSYQDDNFDDISFE